MNHFTSNDVDHFVKISKLSVSIPFQEPVPSSPPPLSVGGGRLLRPSSSPQPQAGPPHVHQQPGTVAPAPRERCLRRPAPTRAHAPSRQEAQQERDPETRHPLHQAALLHLRVPEQGRAETGRRFAPAAPGRHQARAPGARRDVGSQLSRIQPQQCVQPYRRGRGKGVLRRHNCSE
ncbi:hypothetical protein TNCT_517931 [Trichonephila clavata]|uniref:Uncharacterized protein n=1 Tax=Trichonephila clavata TaxID=2740835 RepID=A0A8X6HGZ1_TRICU|nr:hypothetical protein TNCT_517931 [Trichonephila clavata]